MTTTPKPMTTMEAVDVALTGGGPGDGNRLQQWLDAWHEAEAQVREHLDAIPSAQLYELRTSTDTMWGLLDVLHAVSLPGQMCRIGRVYEDLGGWRGEYEAGLGATGKVRATRDEAARDVVFEEVFSRLLRADGARRRNANKEGE